MDNPRTFLENLYTSFKRCRSMEKDGSSKAAVGWAFYKAMCEMFEEDYGKVIPTVDPHVETTEIKPPVAHPVKPVT